MRFETSLQRPFDRSGGGLPAAGGPRFDQLEDEARRDAEDRRRTGWMIAVAAAVHGLILFFAWPQKPTPIEFARGDQTVFVVQSLRFKAPPPPSAAKATPKKKAKRIPIPDPTPDDPEPVVQDELPVQIALDLPETNLPFTIPETAPGAGGGAGPGRAEGVIQVDASVTPPVRVNDPTPPYTEEARVARTQGVVILQAIIDARGLVQAVTVLKGLPFGLSESAIDTIKTWTFRPAVKNGLPVAVYYNLTVRFSLQ